jgi:signal transduction histidine kinase
MMENAFHWCQTTVRVSATTSHGDVLLKVEDDGPGIPESSRREALRSGGRLDTSSPGTGLGMAIAADLIQAYGGTFELDHSKSLNGLCISIAVPTKHGLTSASGA